MKIAFASDNRKEVNQHFGRTKVFEIFDVSKKSCRYVSPVDLKTEGDEQDDKIEERISAIKDCSIVYCTQIGGVAAARLVKNKIHPIKVPAGHSIQEVLAKIQERLQNNPPLWLKRLSNKTANKEAC